MIRNLTLNSHLLFQEIVEMIENHSICEKHTYQL